MDDITQHPLYQALKQRFPDSFQGPQWNQENISDREMTPEEKADANKYMGAGTPLISPTGKQQQEASLPGDFGGVGTSSPIKGPGPIEQSIIDKYGAMSPEDEFKFTKIRNQIYR